MSSAPSPVGSVPPTPSGAAPAPAPGTPPAADEAAKTAPAFPLARIRKIMKEDKDLGKVSNEGVVAVAFSTELFLTYLLERAHEYSQKDKRKTIMYKDVANAVKDIEQLEFLRDAIPPTMPLKEALKLGKEIQSL